MESNTVQSTDATTEACTSKQIEDDCPSQERTLTETKSPTIGEDMPHICLDSDSDSFCTPKKRLPHEAEESGVLEESPKTSSASKHQKMTPSKCLKSIPKRLFRPPSKSKMIKSSPLKRQHIKKLLAGESNIKSRKVQDSKSGNGEGSLDKCDDDISDALEEKATKIRMTAKNVRSVIHHVLKNEQVLSMFRDVLESEQQDGPSQSSPMKEGASEQFDNLPKMTRAKVREFLENFSMPSPVKTTKEGSSILDVEFNEEEDDDEYNPEKDEECHESDDESITSSKLSEFGSPYRDIPSTPVVTPSGDGIVHGTVARETAKDTPTNSDIASTSTTICNIENAAGTETSFEDVTDEVGTIAFRTRSKLPLTSTTITEIESAFVAPDITVDMYDNNYDDPDWVQFLSSLYKTTDDTVTDDDADINDPEFNYIAEAEREQLDEEDFRFDKPTQITKKEMTALRNELNDLFEDEVLPYQAVANASEATGSRISQPWQGMTSFSIPVTYHKTPESVPALSSTQFTEFKTPQALPIIARKKCNTFETVQALQPLMLQACVPTPSFNKRMSVTNSVVTPEQQELIEDNLRKHIQLLLQSYLLCQNSPLVNQAVDPKSMIIELTYLRQSSPAGSNSVFNVCNLDPAIEVVSDQRLLENSEEARSSGPRWKIGAESLCMLSHPQKLVIYNSPAFVYPNLLPPLKKLRESDRKYSKFFSSEDNLIALGLEQFQECPTSIHVELIKKLLIRGKSAEQIFFRVQYMSSGRVSDNPIKCVKKSGKLPSDFPKPTLDNFYPVAPKDQSPHLLPEWCSVCRMTRSNNLNNPRAETPISRVGVQRGLRFSESESGTSAKSVMHASSRQLQVLQDNQKMSITIPQKHLEQMHHSAPLHVQTPDMIPQVSPSVIMQNSPAVQLPSDLPQIAGIYIHFAAPLSRPTGTAATLPTTSYNAGSTTLPTASYNAGSTTLSTASYNPGSTTLPTALYNSASTTLPTASYNPDSTTLPTTPYNSSLSTLPAAQYNSSSSTLPTAPYNSSSSTLPTAQYNSSSSTLPTAPYKSASTTLPTAPYKSASTTLPTLAPKTATVCKVMHTNSTAPNSTAPNPSKSNKRKAPSSSSTTTHPKMKTAHRTAPIDWNPQPVSNIITQSNSGSSDLLAKTMLSCGIEESSSCHSPQAHFMFGNDLVMPFTSSTPVDQDKHPSVRNLNWEFDTAQRQSSFSTTGQSSFSTTGQSSFSTTGQSSFSTTGQSSFSTTGQSSFSTTVSKEQVLDTTDPVFSAISPMLASATQSFCTRRETLTVCEHGLDSMPLILLEDSCTSDKSLNQPVTDISNLTQNNIQQNYPDPLSVMSTQIMSQESDFCHHNNDLNLQSETSSTAPLLLDPQELEVVNEMQPPPTADQGSIQEHEVTGENLHSTLVPLQSNQLTDATSLSQSYASLSDDMEIGVSDQVFTCINQNTKETFISDLQRVVQSDPKKVFGSILDLQPVVQSDPEKVSGSISDLQPVVQSDPEKVSGSILDLQPVVQSDPEKVSGSISDLQPVVQSDPEKVSGSILDLQPVVQSDPEKVSGSISDLQPVVQSDPEKVSGSILDLQPVVQSDPEKVSGSILDLHPVVQSDPEKVSGSILDLQPVVQSDPKVTSIIEQQPVVQSDPKVTSIIELQPIVQSDPKVTSNIELQPIAQSDPKCDQFNSNSCAITGSKACNRAIGHTVKNTSSDSGGNTTTSLSTHSEIQPDNTDFETLTKPKTVKQMLEASRRKRTHENKNMCTSNNLDLKHDTSSINLYTGNPDSVFTQSTDNTEMRTPEQEIAVLVENSETSSNGQHIYESPPHGSTILPSPISGVTLITFHSPAKSMSSSDNSIPSPFKTPTKLRPLAAKSVSPGSSCSSPYVPLPKVSPKRKELNRHVRQILPKSFVFEMKSPSPTKTAAQVLKRKATLFCQSRSPVKLLPKQPLSTSSGATRPRPLLTPSRMFTRSQKTNTKTPAGAKAHQVLASPVVKGAPPDKETKGEPELSEAEDAVLSQEEEEEEFEDEDQSQLDDLMAACTTIGYDPKKGSIGIDSDNKSKAQKRRHICLSMLEPDIIDRDPKKDKRDTAYAQHYFTLVKQVLSNDPERFKKFLTILHDMNKDHMNPTELFADMATLLSEHQDLVDDFAGFLLSFQAVECKRFVSYLEYQQILTFLRKLEIYCDTSNLTYQRTLKMMSRWLTLLNQEAGTVTNPLKERIASVLRHVPNIMDDLKSYFFDTPLPDSHPDDFEEVDLVGDAAADVDEFEEITLPESREDYNTKLCSCQCHQGQQDEKLRRRIKHCFSCSLKIFDGKPVLKTSRNEYRPITVLYPLEEKEKMMKAKKEAAQLALAKARAQRQQNKKKSKKRNVGDLKCKNSKNISVKRKFKKRRRYKAPDSSQENGNVGGCVNEVENKKSDLKDGPDGLTSKQEKPEGRKMSLKSSNESLETCDRAQTEPSSDINASSVSCASVSSTEDSTAQSVMQMEVDDTVVSEETHVARQTNQLSSLTNSPEKDASVSSSKALVNIFSPRYNSEPGVSGSVHNLSLSVQSDSCETRSASVTSVLRSTSLDSSLTNSETHSKTPSQASTSQCSFPHPIPSIPPSSLSPRMTFPQTSSPRMTFPQTSSPRMTFPQTSSSGMTFPLTSSSGMTFPQTSSSRMTFSQTSSSGITFPLTSSSGNTFPQTTSFNCSAISSSHSYTSTPATTIHRTVKTFTHTTLPYQNSALMQHNLQPRFTSSPMVTSTRIPVIVTLSPQQYLPPAAQLLPQMETHKPGKKSPEQSTSSQSSQQMSRDSTSDKLENYKPQRTSNVCVLPSHPVYLQHKTSLNPSLPSSSKDKESCTSPLVVVTPTTTSSSKDKESCTSPRVVVTPTTTSSDSNTTFAMPSSSFSNFPDIPSHFSKSYTSTFETNASLSGTQLDSIVDLQTSDTTFGFPPTTPVKGKVAHAVVRAHLDNFSLGAFEGSISYQQLQQYAHAFSPNKMAADSRTKFDLLALLDSSNASFKELTMLAGSGDSTLKSTTEPLLTFSGALAKMTAISEESSPAPAAAAVPKDLRTHGKVDDIPVDSSSKLHDQADLNYASDDEINFATVNTKHEKISNEACPQTNSTDILMNDESSNAFELSVWTEEQDRAILNVVTVEGVTGAAVRKLRAGIPEKSSEDISSRARLLLRMLEDMGDTESDTGTEASHDGQSEQEI